MAIQITDVTFTVNNENISTVPNTMEFDEGLGEQAVRAMSTGEGSVELVYANNLESNIGMVKVSIPSTVENIRLAKSWKVNRNRNVVVIAGSTDDGDLTRTFIQAALTSNYKVPIGTEADIEIEFMAAQPI